MDFGSILDYLLDVFFMLFPSRFYIYFLDGLLYIFLILSISLFLGGPSPTRILLEEYTGFRTLTFFEKYDFSCKHTSKVPTN